MFIGIDETLEIKELDLYVAKPDKQVIGHLTEAYNKVLLPKLGDINELSFTVPYYVEKRNELIENRNISKLKDRYLIKTIYDGKVEWFRISQNTDSSDDNGETKDIFAYSLGIETKDKLVSRINEVSKDAQYMLDLALQGTGWVGVVDPELLDKYRTIEINEASRLDFIVQISETYGGILVWDTDNQIVYLKMQHNIGANKGLRISYEKYLKSLKRESSDTEMVTRLIPRGKDGLTIRSISPTGVDYFDDYSYFIYPFERDENRNVLKHSDYMDDDLCHAILDYNELVSSKQNEFSTLIQTRNQLNSDLLVKEGELTALETEYAQILDSIDIEQTNNRDTTELMQQKANKEVEINNKKDEIEAIDAQIETNTSNLNSLHTLLSSENNFTVEQLSLLESKYTIVKTWTDENITDPNDLFNEAKLAFAKMREPKIIFTLDIVNFLQTIEGQRDWGKLNLGDTIYIDHERLGVWITAKIIEFRIDFESQSISLTISNTLDILDEEEKFYDRLKTAENTAITVDLEKDKWKQSEKSISEVKEILEDKWYAAKREIVAGVSESVTINNRGITIEDSNDPLRLIRMTNSVIGLTEDGGETFKTAISPSGIVAQEIIGELLVGERLVIDASTTEGTSIFRVESSGVTIEGSKLTILGDQSGVSISPTDGIVTMREDTKVRTTLNSSIGIKIERNTGTVESPTWTDLFYTDTNGNLIAESLIAKKLSIRDGNNNVLIDANTKTIDFSKFTTIAGTLKAVELDGAIGTFTGELIAATGSFAGTLATGHLVIQADSPDIYWWNGDVSTAIEIANPVRITDGVYTWGDPLILAVGNGTAYFQNLPIVFEKDVDVVGGFGADSANIAGLNVSGWSGGTDLYVNGAFSPHFETNFTIYKGYPGSGVERFSIDQFGNTATSGMLTVRGTDFVLGIGATDRGNTGASRALVKGNNGWLIMNYDNDFYGGVDIKGAVHINGAYIDDRYVRRTGNHNIWFELTDNNNLNVFKNGVYIGGIRLSY